jgi:D-beta-D-heptose 7-phosphate kinase / D-beta-D-heptose 1-phosphate adenosyltransferase
MIHLKSKNPKVLVVGDLMIDNYLWGKANRISPEAPVQIVDIDEESAVLGGAGNVMNNLLSLGASVSAASVIGKDENGENLLGMLESVGINTHMVLMQEGRKTSKKSRLMAAHQQVIRFDSESKESIDQASEDELLILLQNSIDSFDIVLLSDYKKGVLTPSFTEALIVLAKHHGKKVLVDPKGNDYSKYRGATLITPNKKEASLAAGIEIVDAQSLKIAGEFLRNDLLLDASVITLSEEGMAIFDEFGTVNIKATAKEVYDVTGAGDTVLATLGFGLAAGVNLLEAAKMANAAAAVVVGKLGSATVCIDEIIAYESTQHHQEIDQKICTFENIEKKIVMQKGLGKKIVFTNGCFDILHRGHVEYLKASRAEGDILVLGLNADSSVRKLKGDSRPVVSEDDRAYILSALSFIDYVVIFDEETPYELIKLIKPDILTKGADYEGKEVVGSDIAGVVKLIDFVEGKSTTKTIEKIRS